MSDTLATTRHALLESAASMAKRSAGRGDARGTSLLPFLERYHRHTTTEDLFARQAEDLLGAALSHRSLAAKRPEGTAAIHVFNPDMDEHGWASGHTVVQVVTDDMPFIVDSVIAALAALDRNVFLLLHPQLVVRRDATGRLEEVLDADEVHAGTHSETFGEQRESWLHIEIDRTSDPAERERIADRLRTVLDDVRVAVEDWGKMTRRCWDIAAGLKESPPTCVDAEEVRLTVTFLEWLADNHFTFLGYREYALERRPDGLGDQVRTTLGTGLGLLRSDPAADRMSVDLTPQASEVARRKELLIITKANSRSTVHRPVHMDYISVRTFDEAGEVTGEQRFIGLFASTAYTESVMRIPLVRDKVQAVIEGSGFTPDSHSGKDLLGVLETYPRDELFQAEVPHLRETALAVSHMQERRGTRLFLRRDDFGRYVSCLVYIPRDRYNTAVRLRMERILREAWSGASTDYTTRVGESKLARLHFVVRMARGEAIPDVDVSAVERQLLDATRTWEEDLADSMRTEIGEEGAARMMGLYGKSFPPAYEDDFPPRMAIADMRHLEALTREDATGRALYQSPGAPEDERRFKLFRRKPVSLTDVLPVFTDLGVEVVDERPYDITRGDGVRAFIYDLGLRIPDGSLWTEGSRERVRELFQDAVGAIWDGRAESDGFNALVLEAGLTWRQVAIIRTIGKYLRQTRTAFSQPYLEAALVVNHELARLLVDLFETRFDPHRYASGGSGESDSDVSAERTEAVEALERTILDALDDVTSLDHDRIIRAFLGVIMATLRTNYFQVDADGEPKTYISLKLEPAKVPDMPSPKPAFEIWVYSPRVEGVHLRFGPVARGGLRWSDRREDFRTEVLGLVKAQMVKNAVIVPTGSKGGFFAKRLPDPAQDRDAWLNEGIEAYKVFISGLLDVTDNRLDGEIVPPPDVVRHDGSDPYLVVAADKGTASFSDIANSVSQGYGFWLDDAFASGGSAGYDHKGMGITARGAWESVKRHFRELGLNTQEEEFTVLGIGDMSGDVFGNGMLLSEHIRLVAAFDHRHIFLDPDPDAAASYAERRRLFDLPRSSWADYDESLISEGGGVYARTLKSIPLTDQVRDLLDLTDDRTAMTPSELIRALLLAPVDLLWNGGIGTYVKASTETDADIGDRANDSIRVNGHELRVRVVGEGGNLGMSQLGRIEAALHGVRVNTDAIDNSAGVDTSDHEVNIKILLGEVVRAGDLTMKQRNQLLASMTDEVARQVLRTNYEQNVLLGNARAQEHSMLSVHERLIQWLERRGDLDRSLEFLPDDQQIAQRAGEGLGLKSPEFSVLVAYAKLALKHDLMPTTLPDDPYLQRYLADYFPAEIRRRYGDRLDRHPLRREIIVNAVANTIVNRGGITFAFRVMEETGAGPEQVARAFVVAREIFDMVGFVGDVEALDNQVSTQVQSDLYLEFRRLIDRAVRWFITARPARLDIETEVARYRPVIDALGPQVPSWLRGAELKRLQRRVGTLTSGGAPEQLAVRSASGLDQFSLLDIVDVASSTGKDPAEVGPLYFVLSERFGIDVMLGKVARLPREDRWDGLARGALRDDLYGVLESLAEAVIADCPDGDISDPDAAFEVWATRNHDTLQRARSSLVQIERMESPNIAALSVALRTLRSVLRSGAATT
ncbi:NAD-glutamate dehydrogenase [Nostocoides sp. F2B08]|uniref:NAD-glutamate dehydrogenase n=1 Tax=Nostocoides sp. F2B08 TaxID=2653936 RepID=UPI001263620D|nr:NAD-glutamate dehydrogenase [Tetrasphaera sp. F2B08]KAB7741840.1 NAD-glutamate dehydrogenase [Tetrasphaera sp. F2B08]